MRPKEKSLHKICSIMLSGLLCLTVIMASAAEIKTGSITGRVMIKDGLPMADGVVYIFDDISGPPPAFDKYWRVPDEIIKLDSAGKFVANLIDGRYYIGAIKRISGDEIGPLQEGDLFLPFHVDGKPRQFNVVSGSATDIGVISGAATYRRSDIKTGEGITAIEGTISDTLGKPLANALVFAFQTPAMVGKPLFIAEKTGKDGKYLLRVQQGGNYYLKIRSFYGGGAMKAGELMGIYGVERPLAVAVQSGSIVRGINITGSSYSGQGLKKK